MPMVPGHQGPSGQRGGGGGARPPRGSALTWAGRPLPAPGLGCWGASGARVPAAATRCCWLPPGLGGENGGLGAPKAHWHVWLIFPWGMQFSLPR